MAEGSNWVEIVLLAMLAAFIGLRLVSVLGKRTGHEPVPRDSFRPGSPEIIAAPPRTEDASPRPVAVLPAGTDAALAPALENIINADPQFEPDRFVANATAAYRMILEAFWSGNAREMEGLVSDEVQEQFAEAIEAREGKRLHNRIASIDSATITAAAMTGQMAEVTVRFVAQLGSKANDDTAGTADIWTFSRHIGSPDPAWLLIATDAEA